MTVSSTIPTPKSALHEILNWSVDRVEWQRDALRRIIENGTLAKTDIEELERICRSRLKVETVKPAPIASTPLTATHLPPAPGVADSVSLVSISDLKNVNRLPHGSTIPFGVDTGLAIIYGGNGAGKSSYARVIKKACRARGARPNISSNAFLPPTTKPASANIAFKIGSTEVSVSWADGVTADPRLANVFVFDSFAADHYVSADSAAAFTPHGLDVLPTLSKACDALAERLKLDIAQWQTAINSTSANWNYEATTEVGKCIQKLSATTQEAVINGLAVLDQKQADRLVILRDVLKTDPLQKAKETRAAFTRLDLFATRINSAIAELADERTEQIRRQLENAKAADSAAKAFAAGEFDTSFLAGTGSDLWRTLWDAARTYSNIEAYADKDFPVVSDDARCVLCQQDLDDVASKRLSGFDNFCKNQSQQLSVQAELALSTTHNKLNLVTPLAPDLVKVDADLASLTAEERFLISDFIDKADTRLQQITQCLVRRDWIAPVGITASPELVVRGVMTNLETRAKTEESAHDPNTRKKLEAELLELVAREWLLGIKADVLGQIERFKAIAELKTCEKELKTASITTKSSQLTQLFVTDAFQKRFQSELGKLGLRTLKVLLEPVQGQKGETKFGLRLVAAGNSKVMDVASEGEKRCIALAAFMAELSQASHQSALVFDDPVSSLDHWHRERIAERLVAEANNRQVIAFTHDAVFLNDLLAFADKTTIVPNVLTLEWDKGSPGKYVQGLPWDSKKPLDCLAELEKNQKVISTNWNPLPNELNIEAMRHAYSRLRSTMERIVEIELLDGIVCRFESQVKAGRVASLIGVTQKECDEANRLLQKCHKITDAHAPSTSAIPTPADFLQDIADAKQLITDIRTRKKLNQASAGML
jgi:energy-coupling factor transporter ATP-binding protein EcfA2